MEMLIFFATVLSSRYNFHHTRANRKRGRGRVLRMKFAGFVSWLAILGALFITGSSYAQDRQQESSSKPGDAAAPKKADKSGKDSTNKDSATKNAPDQPMWDPLRAEKDIEV